HDALPIFKKVLESAIANAEHNEGADVDELKVKTILVEQGMSLKRFQARKGPRQPHHQADLPYFRDSRGRREQEGAGQASKEIGHPWDRKFIRSASGSASTRTGPRAGTPTARTSPRC